MIKRVRAELEILGCIIYYKKIQRKKPEVLFKHEKKQQKTRTGNNVRNYKLLYSTFNGFGFKENAVRQARTSERGHGASCSL